jgi:outer membrane protein
MKRIIVAIIALALFATPVLAETKIAWVDMQQALNNCEAGAAAKNQLNELVSKYDEEYKAKQEALQALQQDAEKQAAMLSDDAKKEKVLELQKKYTELTQLKSQIQSDLQQKDSELTTPIIQELLAMLKELSEKGGYDLVFTKDSLIFYEDTVKDLTADLIAAHDAQ